MNSRLQEPSGNLLPSTAGAALRRALRRFGEDRPRKGFVSTRGVASKFVFKMSVREGQPASDETLTSDDQEEWQRPKGRVYPHRGPA